MPKFLDVTDKAAAKAVLNADFYINAKDFGAVGDGVTDDTDALQDWVEHLVSNSAKGWLPNGSYLITETLVAPSGYDWSITGEGPGSAIIVQDTDNVAVLQLGTTNLNSHSIALDSFMLKYSSAQPSTNTNANCIQLEGTAGGVGYWLRFTNLRFFNGYYGFKCVSGKVGPWGSYWDNILLNSMSGGMLDSTGTITGLPGNKWGRFYIDCSGCVGPIFKAWSSHSTTVETLEFLNATDCQIISTQSGFSADIGCIRMENATYTAANKPIDFTGNYFVRIGQVSIDADCSPASGVLYMVNASSSTAESRLEISSYDLNTAPVSGTCVAVGAGTSVARVSIGNIRLNGWPLHYNSGGSQGNSIRVESWVNDAISDDKGDADYTVAPGDANIVVFNTPFTAQRTITLPTSTSPASNTCAGLYYELVFNGAINGANTAVIKHGSTTLRTQTLDGQRVRYTWRRNAWVLTEVANIVENPSTDVQVFTSSGTWTKPTGAKSVRVRCIGPGGGGGAGARGPSGTALSGGGGGSSGGMSEMMFDASDLSSTVAVTVGTGGAGAVGQTSNDSAGANGSAGSSDTTFAAYLRAGRGTNGNGGGLGVAGAGGGSSSVGWSLGMFVGGSGGSGSATGAAGAWGTWTTGPGGGAGGGGITTAPAATAGGVGGLSYSTNLSGGTSGSGAVGGNGNSSSIKGPGTGGGGGGGNVSGTGYDGGDGGDYGAGGGGGGAALNGNTSGAGGNGGDGVCIVTTYF